jgi:pimeloyl-ACP methyl ester carboxylesterase
MLSQVYEAFGGWLLGAARGAQRRAVRAEWKQHRDKRGRVTPYLECGQALAPVGTIVWLHGFSDEPDSFMQTARGLAGRYRIVAPALPGFGGWVDRNERHTLEAYAAWLGEVVHDLGGERFHLMGNSLGGAAAIAIAAADHGAHVASLVPVNSAGLDIAGVRSVNDEMREGHNLFAVHDRAGYDGFLKRIFAKPPLVPGPVRAKLTSQLSGSAQWYDRIVADMLESARLPAGEGVMSSVDLPSINAPTLVVWGDRDTLFPLAHAQHLARAIPNVKLEVLEGVGHCPHIESPARLATAVRSFFDTIG